jgi:mandelate racemase
MSPAVAASMTGPGTGLVVRDVTVRTVVVPFRRPLATKVGHFAQWPLLLIDIHTEPGLTGHGYLAPYLPTAASAVRAVVADLGAALRGRPAAPAAAAQQARGWFALAGYQGLALSAVAGLDIALWDVLAQAAGLPLAAALGGTLAPVPAYNSNGLGLIPPDAVADEALELLAEGGFTALKVRVGRDRAADDLTAVRRVREAVGSDVTLVADYNQGLALGDALMRCRALDGEGLTWIEEPLRYDDLAGHARLARDIATPVMLGENFYGPRAMADAIQAQACDLVMPDLMRIGGVTGWLQAAALADSAGLPMSSHLYPEVSGHLLRVTPTQHWLEWQDWADPILACPFRVADGLLHLPDVPGNGLTWNEDAVTHYQVD